MTDTLQLAELATQMLADRAARVLATIPRATRPHDAVDQIDGVPLYVRGHAPAHLRSRSQLADARRKPAPGAQPAGYVRAARHHDVVPLYDPADTVPMRPLSTRQRAAWIARRTCVQCRQTSQAPQPYAGPRCYPCHQLQEQAAAELRARTCKGCGRVDDQPQPRYGRCQPCAERYAADLAERARRRERTRQASIEQWARDVLADPDAVTLDLETTGLGRAYTVEVAVVRMNGTPVLDTLVNPGVPIPPPATEVHGITDQDVKDAPTWPQVLPDLVTTLAGRRIIIYNAAFDTRILRCEMDRYHRTEDPRTAVPDHLWHPLAGTWIDGLRVECAMEAYAEWVGEWSSYHGNWRYWPLPGGHRAADDCRALIHRLQYLAQQEPDTKAT